MKRTLTPRKTPVQARSAKTVEAILDASIHILLDGGSSRFTTTRVAERAGASVGSLYQYFRDRDSLLACVLERHLTQVVETVESAALLARGCPLDVMATRLVDAFVEAKFAQPEASRALYAVANELGSAQVVHRMTLRSQQAVCDMLATAPDQRIREIGLVAFVICTALVGPVQAALGMAEDPSALAALKRSLATMVGSYLVASST